MKIKRNDSASAICYRCYRLCENTVGAGELVKAAMGGGAQELLVVGWNWRLEPARVHT